MKIVLDARDSGTTTGRYMDKLIENLHVLKAPYSFTILTKAHRVDFFEKIAPSFTTIETPFKEFSFGEQIGFKKQISNLKPDLVHFMMVQQPILYGGKTVTTMHDLTGTRFRNPSKNWLVYSIKQQVYKFVNWYVPRRSKKIIVPSNFVKEDIVSFSHVPEDKFVVTYESADKIIDPPEVVPGLTNKLFIFYTGRPMPHKNLEGLIDAFVILKKQKPGLKLVLSGKKDVIFENIEKKVVERQINDVIFPGFVSEGQLRWLYENCLAYIFPSFSEGFGLPGLEAMAMGAPVISSNATCLPEIYGNAAVYFDPSSPIDMAQVINKVIDDDKLRKNLVKLGGIQATKYSWKKMAEETLAVYKEVLG